MHDLIPPQIESYCIAKSSTPSALCDELEDFTKTHVDMAQMLIGKLEASLLGFLIHSLDAKRVLEIGTFTGYSALAMAEILPGDGEIVTLDVSKERTKIAQKFWNRSPHGKKITLVLGRAEESLRELQGPFDLIFIDADKEQCLSYFKRGCELLSPKGVVVVDNCLWDGKVFEQRNGDAETKGIKELTDFIHADLGLYSTLLPVRDGVLLVWQLTSEKKDFSV